jgi:hypothetical protein
MMRVENDILVPEFAEWLSKEKQVYFTPSGVSMRPFIEGDKDSVTLVAMDRAPQRGDIVLALVKASNGNKTYVLHRLVRIENHQSSIIYVLQGDGNLSGEEICRREDIIGRVVAIDTPQGRRKRLTRGFLWHRLFPLRRYLLKIYRHTWLKWNYK